MEMDLNYMLKHKESIIKKIGQEKYDQMILLLTEFQKSKRINMKGL